MFLGIDLGTSGVKVLLMDGAQNVLGTATRRLTVAGGAPPRARTRPAPRRTPKTPAGGGRG
ncbi:hypothetical protein, partial [Paenirhodobacter sp.]|uniref:hypothetical protein n=1 Tax=Paenirhodobacter sp. TaxID=1965326 RepID=UPI003B5063E9